MDNKQKFREFYKKSSQQIKELVAAPEFDSFFDDIATSYNFTPKQKDALTYVVTCILIGIENEENLTNKIESELLIQKDIAEKVRATVVTEILGKIDQLHGTVLSNIDAEEDQGKSTVGSSSQKSLNTDKSVSQQIRSLKSQKSAIDLLKSI